MESRQTKLGKGCGLVLYYQPHTHQPRKIEGGYLFHRRGAAAPRIFVSTARNGLPDGPDAGPDRERLSCPIALRSGFPVNGWIQASRRHGSSALHVVRHDESLGLRNLLISELREHGSQRRRDNVVLQHAVQSLKIACHLSSALLVSYAKSAATSLSLVISQPMAVRPFHPRQYLGRYDLLFVRGLPPLRCAADDLNSCPTKRC